MGGTARPNPTANPKSENIRRREIDPRSILSIIPASCLAINFGNLRLAAKSPPHRADYPIGSRATHAGSHRFQ
jgi:hypothetical protein